MIAGFENRFARATGAAPAVPAGGACPEGRGRGRLFALALAASLAAGTAAAGQDLPALPSGLTVVLQEAVLDVKPDGELTYARYRFVAPAIGAAGGPTFAQLADDFQVLCDRYVLPLALANPPVPDRIVISIADRETELGVANPDAKQYFELFRPESARCIWEEF